MTITQRRLLVALAFWVAAVLVALNLANIAALIRMAL